MEDSLQPLDVPQKEKAKKKKPKPSRTAETMYRTTMGSQIRLSEMTDNKARLMVSINSIIISIMTSFLVHEYTTNPRLLLPTALLVVVCLLTITFALMSTKPTIKNKQNGADYKLDLLFFGDYTTLSLDEYKVAMKNMMSDNEQLNETMIESIYAQGKVIAHKFKLLNISYIIFMYGFPLAIVCLLLMLTIG